MGFISGGTDLASANSAQIATLFGAETRLGIQLNDWFAVMYQGSFTLLWPDARSAALLEASLTRYVSLGVGLGVDWIIAVTSGAGGTDGSVSVGVPIRIAFNIPTTLNEPFGVRSNSNRNQQRYGLALGMELTPGVAVAHTGIGSLPTGTNYGALGSVSFEMY